MAADWFTVSEAARYLGVSETTLRKWTDEGRIAVFRTPGRHRRYLRDSLNRFREGLEEPLQEGRVELRPGKERA